MTLENARRRIKAGPNGGMRWATQIGALVGIASVVLMVWGASRGVRADSAELRRDVLAEVETRVELEMAVYPVGEMNCRLRDCEGGLIALNAIVPEIHADLRELRHDVGILLGRTP